MPNVPTLRRTRPEPVRPEPPAPCAACGGSTSQFRTTVLVNGRAVLAAVRACNHCEWALDTARGF